MRYFTTLCRPFLFCVENSRSASSQCVADVPPRRTADRSDRHRIDEQLFCFVFLSFEGNGNSAKRNRKQPARAKCIAYCHLVAMHICYSPKNPFWVGLCGHTYF